MHVVNDNITQSPEAAHLDPLPVTIITPSKGWVALKLREVWEYRELLYFLAWRDVVIRYKQTSLGVAWAIIQPLVMMVVFTQVFHKWGGIPSDHGPYQVSTFAALLPWQLFAGALSRASSSLVGSASLLTKVYFPRLIIPISAVFAGLVDFAIALVILAGLMCWYHKDLTISWTILTLPLFTLLAMLTAFAVGLWLSALNVEYRDVQYVIPFLVQIWFFASPVAYSAGIIYSPTWKLLFSLNPMAGVIQGFRWALLGGDPPGVMLEISTGIVLLLLISGLYNFKRMERVFADVI